MIRRMVEGLTDSIVSIFDTTDTTDDRLTRIEKRVEVIFYFVVVYLTFRAIGFAIGMIIGVIEIIVFGIR